MRYMIEKGVPAPRLLAAGYGDWFPKGIDSIKSINPMYNPLTLTWGDGEQPDNAIELYDSSVELEDNYLQNVNFAVLALGDTAFDLFCEAGIQWDSILEQKGANRINERIDCDTDYDDYAEEWLEETILIFADKGV